MPIDIAHVVAILISLALAEGHALPLERRVIRPRKCFFATHSRMKFDAPEFSDEILDVHGTPRKSEKHESMESSIIIWQKIHVKPCIFVDGRGEFDEVCAAKSIGKARVWRLNREI